MYADLEEERAPTWIKATSRMRLFNPEGKGEPILFTPLASTMIEGPEEAYPFKAILGSLRFHLGSGTRTSLSERIRDFALKGEVEISPEDGNKLNLNPGDQVAISSPRGAISREVTFKNHLSPGLIFVPMAFQDNDANELLGLTPLGTEDSPGWKVVPVKLEKGKP